MDGVVKNFKLNLFIYFRGRLPTFALYDGYEVAHELATREFCPAHSNRRIRSFKMFMADQALEVAEPDMIQIQNYTENSFSNIPQGIIIK